MSSLEIVSLSVKLAWNTIITFIILLLPVLIPLLIVNFL